MLHVIHFSPVGLSAFWIQICRTLRISPLILDDLLVCGEDLVCPILAVGWSVQK